MTDGLIAGTLSVRMIDGSETPIETAKQFAAELQSAWSASIK